MHCKLNSETSPHPHPSPLPRAGEGGVQRTGRSIARNSPAEYTIRTPARYRAAMPGVVDSSIISSEFSMRISPVCSPREVREMYS